MNNKNMYAIGWLLLSTLLFTSSASANQIVYSSNTHKAHFGDINGDGINDLLLQGNSAIYPSQWVKGEQDETGIARYYKHNAYAIYQPLHQFNLTLGDVNGDGHTDIITPQGIYFADTYGIGGMVENPLNLPSDNYLLKTGDFNGDGKTDLLALSLNPNSPEQSGPEQKNQNSKEHFLFHSQLTEGPVFNEHLVLVQELKNRRWAKTENNGSQTSLAERIDIIDINGDGFDDIFARAYKANKKHYLVYSDENGLFSEKNTKQLKAQITDVDWDVQTYWVNVANLGQGNQPKATRMNNYSGGIDEQGNITPISLDPTQHTVTLDTLEAEVEKNTANSYLLPQTKSLGGIGSYPDTYFYNQPNSYIPYTRYYNVTASAVSNAVFYRLYVSSSEYGTYTKIREVSAPSNGSGPQFDNIFSGYFYGYRYLKYDACITASNCTGLSPWRRIVVYTTPMTPTWITTTKDPVSENDNFQVVFPAANGAVDGTSYKIYEKNPLGEERLIQTLYRNHWSETQYSSYAISHTIAGTYHYRVNACNPYTDCGGSISTSLVVLGNNDAPIAANDTATAHQGSSVNINVLANDKDPNGDSLTVSSASANKGSVTINSNGTLSYTSMGTGNDTGTITYTASDQKGGYTTAYVTVTIKASNANPNVPPSVVTASAPSDSDVIASAQIGLTKAQFRVDESGAATYSMPVAMPSGIAGVTPSLSVQYSSNAPNGIMGVGWGLGGTSAITRCRQTLEQDGAFKAITLTNADRFCYNGQRLIAVAGENGANGTVYQTEIDSQVRVISYNGTANGPAYFTVERPDGSTSYYGQNDTSSTAYIKTQDNTSGVIISWLLSKSHDNMARTENTVYYTYTAQDSNGTAFGEREKHLSKIAYSGNTVNLEYNSAGQRPDTGFAYIAGYKIEQTARLDSINITSHKNSAEVINAYHFNYTQTGQLYNDDTQLTSILQCADNTQTLCLPATTFDWKNNFYSGQAVTQSTFTFNQLYSVQGLDFNQDNVSDLLYLNRNNNDFSVHFLRGLGNGQYYEHSANADISINHTDIGSVENHPIIPKVQTFDFEGDGRTELAIAGRHNNVWIWTLYRYNDTTGTYGVFETLSDIDEIAFLDLNGDGLADMLYRDTAPSGAIETNYIRFNLGGDFQSPIDAQTISFPNTNPYIEQSNGSLIAITDFYPSLLAHTITDLNGDGLADVLVAMTKVRTDHSDGMGCQQSVTEYTQAYTTQIDTNGNISFSEYGTLPGETITSANGCQIANDEGFTAKSSSYRARYSTPASTGQFRPYMVDINNDGMTDVLYKNRTTHTWQTIYSTGASFGAETAVQQMPEAPNNITFIDTDNDGDLELLYTDTSCEFINSNWCSHENVNGQLAAKATESRAEIAIGDIAHWSDVNQNGQSDLLVIDAVNKTINGRYNSGNNHNSRIKAITDGFGVTTNITYKPLTDNSVYTKANNATSITDYGNGSPVFDLLAPSYVVSTISSDAPSYDDSGEYHQQNNQLYIDYTYHGLKAQAGGRGSLGFAQITSYDRQSNITTQTHYRQDYPYIGMPKETLQCVGNQDCNTGGTRLARSAMVFNDSEEATTNEAPTSLHNGKILTPHVFKTIDYNYGFNSNGTSTYLGNTTTYTIKQVAGNDSYLQIKQISAYTLNASGVIEATKRTTNTYNQENPTNWWINRLTHSEAYHNQGSSSVYRYSAFEYDSTTGLLTREITEPDSTNVQLYSQKAYQHDQYGNIIASTVCSFHFKDNCGTAAASSINTDSDPYKIYRQERNTFDANGRYVVSTHNLAFSNINTIQARNAWGRVTQATDIDGKVATNQYDSFGALYYSTDNTGAGSQIISKLKAAAEQASWPNISEPYHFVTQTIQAGKPTSYVYTNKLGQQVASVTQGFDSGSWIHQYTRYNKLGRVVRQSLPFYAGNSIKWQQTTYDQLGRPIKTINADSSSETEINYQELTTTTTTNVTSTVYGADSNSKTQTHNIHGQTVSVTDNQGTIHYTYDAMGNLLTTQGVDGAIMTMSYSNGRHKTSMNDPDKGKWQYRYNAADELVWQQDPRGYKTTIYRDNVGRTTRKVVQNSANTVIEENIATYSGHQLTQEHITGSNFKRCYAYDNLGRNNTVITILDGKNCHASSEPTIINKKYTERTTFDQHGRVFQQFDPSGDSKGTENVYNSRGYLVKQVEARNSANGNPAVLSEILAIDAQGNITKQKGAAGKTTETTYNTITGLVTAINTHSQAIQYTQYQYDGFGRLRQRNNVASGVSQNFTYDNAHRLTTISGYQPFTLSYSANGNILTKSNLENGATYTYANTSTGVTGSHALTKVGNLSYQYDGAGNQTQAKNASTVTRQVSYNHFSKPTLIDDKDGTTTHFEYGPSNNRFKRIDTKNGQTTTTYYIGNIEVITLPSGVIETKRYVSNAIQTVRTNGTAQTHYLYYDNLGSVDAIINEQGKTVTRMYFAPFGQKLEIAEGQWSATAKANAAFTLTNLSDLTNRGYTGHEHLDSFNLIHMNGRVYDPITGRFIQADPFVQEAQNSQNLNRYTYVLNNPLGYTDPSGYLFAGLLNKLKPYASAIISTGLVLATGGTGSWFLASWQGAATLGAISSFYGAAINGGNIFRAAAIGAFSGATFHGIGQSYTGAAGTKFAEGGAAHIMAHAMVGGIISVTQGGKFGHGFISAGFSKFAMSSAGFDYDDISAGAIASRTMIAALIGGTSSVLSGGKFENGAKTAAMAQLLNQEASNYKKQSAATVNDTTENAKEKRAKLVEAALKSEGDKSYAKSSSKGRFKKGTWKCNLFIADKLIEVGIDPVMLSEGSSEYMTANGWANKNHHIEGWEIVDTPMPGDVAAIPRSGGSGHVGIYIENRGLFKSNVMAANEMSVSWSPSHRNNDVANFMASARGDTVYRRYVGGK